MLFGFDEICVFYLLELFASELRLIKIIENKSLPMQNVFNVRTARVAHAVIKPIVLPE